MSRARIYRMLEDAHDRLSPAPTPDADLLRQARSLVAGTGDHPDFVGGHRCLSDAMQALRCVCPGEDRPKSRERARILGIMNEKRSDDNADSRRLYGIMRPFLPASARRGPESLVNWTHTKSRDRKTVLGFFDKAIASIS